MWAALGLIASERWRGLRRALAVALVLLVGVVAVLGVVQVRNFINGLTGHAGQQTIDRSGPVLLQQMRDLSRYEGSSGSFQVIVDLEKDTPFLPSAIVGQRTLFVAVGSVNAYVDFSGLSQDAVTVSPDHRSAEIRLPHAVLDQPSLDYKHSYVFAEDRGIVNRIQAFFDQAPNDQSELYQLAQQKIADAASQSGLTDRAEANTRTMLVDMLHSLGYQHVTVTFY